MVCGNIQKFEIIFIIFDLRTFDHFIAHTDEDMFYLFLGDLIGMAVSDRIPLRRKGDVDLLRCKLTLEGFALQHLLCHVHIILCQG